MISPVIAPKMIKHPIALTIVSCSCKITIPKMTLVTGSNILRIEAVAAPKYRTPCCKQMIPIIDVKMAINNEYP